MSAAASRNMTGYPKVRSWFFIPRFFILSIFYSFSGKDLDVGSIATDIQNTIGKTLTGAFSQMHVHQPSDPRSFLANYLINVDRNEMVMKQKLDLFRNT